MNRRQFLASAALAAVAPRSTFAATPSRIEILPDEPIGTISPMIYSHFTEHIGGVIYDGVWVGTKSKIPNIEGIRKELVDRLKTVHPAVIRWPGGCFADSYNWRDGIGPRERRPVDTNFWANTPLLENMSGGPQKYESNDFGTNDFARFCKLVGAQPYFAANLRSATARDFYEWVEYCNSPARSTTLANIRAEGGSPDPFPVKFWGVGNESWGCGGNFTGAEYAVEFRRYTEWVPNYGVDLSFIASGPNAGDYKWTESFFPALVEKGEGALRNVFGFALHYYCGSIGKTDSLQFSTEEYFALLSSATVMEDLIVNHWQLMGQVDRKHSVKLVVDEWGPWHATAGIAPGYLWGYYPTLRDALVSGITLNIFNRHADKVVMANDAQLINNINALFVAAEDRFTVTPIFHVFDLFAPHQGGTSLRTVFSVRNSSDPGAHKLPVLSGSCSLKGSAVTLTVVNTNVRNPEETTIGVRGRQISNVTATVLTSKELNAHNSFDQPHALEPSHTDVSGGGESLSYSFAPASLTRLEFSLA